MNILITIDDNYVDIATDLLFSLKYYNSDLVIHVVYDDNLSSNSIDKIKDYIETNKIGELKLHHFDSEQLNLKVLNSEYITKTCYLRLFAPYLIEDVDRMLYLDPDIVCQKSLKEFYEMDLGDNIIAACPNMLREEVAFLKEIMLNNIRLPLDTEYVNSGVLLIDAKKYREYVTIEQISRFLINNSDKLSYQDQDTVNFVFQGKIKVVDNKYNYQINAVDWWKINFDQALIHYSEAKKPWKLDYCDVFRARPYYKLLYNKKDMARLINLIYCHASNEATKTLEMIENESFNID